MLLRRGFALEYATLAWNVAGIVVLAAAAISARSVALAGFALDSLIEIGASLVVIWELSGTGAERQRRGLRLIGMAEPYSCSREQLLRAYASVGETASRDVGRASAVGGVRVNLLGALLPTVAVPQAPVQF